MKLQVLHSTDGRFKEFEQVNVRTNGPVTVIKSSRVEAGYVNSQVQFFGIAGITPLAGGTCMEITGQYQSNLATPNGWETVMIRLG
jgi:hypothetical protein